MSIDATDATETEIVTAAEVSKTAPANRVLKLAIVALAAISLGLAVLAASLSARNRDTEGRTAAVRRAAAAMGTAMLSYDYQDLDGSKDRVVALATGKFKEEYRKAFDAQLDVLYTQTKGVSKVRDVAVFVSDVSAEQALAIVEVDYLQSGVAGKNRPRTAYLELTLVHVGDRWLVDNVSSIQTPQPETSTPAE